MTLTEIKTEAREMLKLYPEYELSDAIALAVDNLNTAPEEHEPDNWARDLVREYWSK